MYVFKTALLKFFERRSLNSHIISKTRANTSLVDRSSKFELGLSYTGYYYYYYLVVIKLNVTTGLHLLLGFPSSYFIYICPKELQRTTNYKKKVTFVSVFRATFSRDFSGCCSISRTCDTCLSS